MIRVADRSEYGWAVVEEYECDPLTSDSEDEKRLVRAEKNAKRKVMKGKRQNAAQPRENFRPASSAASRAIGSRTNSHIRRTVQ